MLWFIVGCTGLNSLTGGKIRRSPTETADSADTGPVADSAETGGPGETGESGAPDSVETGAPDSGDSAGDSGDSGGDSGEDTAVEPPTEVCYLGEDRAGETCFPLVDWDPAWGEDYEYPEPYGGSAQYAAPARYLDLSTLDPSTKLAPNFALDELMQEEKGQYGLFQTHVVEHLQGIRDDSGGAINVNSGYRNITWNAGVGGVSSSRHLYGDAVDITSAVLDLDELAGLCSDWGADYTEVYESHVHCDWRDDPLDPAFYDVAWAAAPPSAPRPVLAGRLVRGPTGFTAPVTGFDEGEPARRWEALDLGGRVLKSGSGPGFTAPPGATRVRVVVGGRLTLGAEVDAAP